MRKMLMEMPDFGMKMVITMEEKNKEIVDEIWQELPFTCVQEHGMVSGDLIYCWVPVLSVAPCHFRLKHTESPLGTVNYSQGTGNKILIKYGECNEDLSAPVIGYIAEKDLPDLTRYSRAIWNNYFLDKKEYHVTFSKFEEE